MLRLEMKQVKLIYIYIYEHLTGEEMLTYDQSRIKEQVTLTYSPIGKVIVKQKILTTNFKNK